MGRISNEGKGYGMTESEAREDFANSLRREHGEDPYGGSDITDWVNARCIKQPKPGKRPTKTKAVKSPNQPKGKLVNGYEITNDTGAMAHKRFLAEHRYSAEKLPPEITEFALKQADAKKIAASLALKHNCEFIIKPARISQDERTKKLSHPSTIVTVQPTGGKEGEPGEWHFKVLCRS